MVLGSIKNDERVVQIFTEMTLNDICCSFTTNSHRFHDSFFYKDIPLLQGWTNANYMERVATALRVNIVEFIEDGKPEIGDSPIQRVILHSLFTTPVENWIYISTRYNTSVRNTLQPHQRRIDHRPMYGLCQSVEQSNEIYAQDRELQRLAYEMSYIMTDAEGLTRDNMPFMMDNQQVSDALVEMWTMEVNANAPDWPMSDHDEYVRNHCHQYCYSVDWQQNQRTLNTTPKVIKRAHNDNNVLRALLTLCHTEETEHWTLDGEPSNQHQAGSSLKYDFIQMIGFRKYYMTAF